jgi:hypothetical protein
LIPKVTLACELGNAILANAVARAGLGNAVVNVVAAVGPAISIEANALVRATLIDARAAIAIDPARRHALVDIRRARDPCEPWAANTPKPEIILRCLDTVAVARTILAVAVTFSTVRVSGL